MPVKASRKLAAECEMTDEARGATMWYSKTGDDKVQEIGYKKAMAGRSKKGWWFRKK
jgi:hypothetical protein